MKSEKTRDMEFDAVDEAIAAALGEATAWPVPPAGFKERCADRVAKIVAEGKSPRAQGFFAGMLWMKAAAILLILLGFATILFRYQQETSPQFLAGAETGEALIAQSEPTLIADGLYEEVEECGEVQPLPTDIELIAEAAKATIPQTPATKMVGSLCLAALKLTGV